jgi:aryl-alcohol dehydrogenase-like predicted oxidoreductase
MQYRMLGKTGVTVSRIGLGCGGVGGVGSAPAFFGMGESEQQARELMDAAWEMGITLFDTADAYGGGRSESAIGGWLRTKGSEVRERIVLTTKVFHSVVGDPSDRGLSRDRIRRQIQGSLARLGVERVDLYMIHEPDPETPLDETLGALDGLVRDGRVGAFGACNIEGSWLERALEVSAERSLGTFGWVQNSFSLLDRAAEEDVLPVSAREGVGFTPFSPLAGGWLTGKYASSGAPPQGSRMALRPEPYARFQNATTRAAIDRFCEAARQRGVDPASLAIAWLLGHPLVDAVIVGPRRPEHLEAARRALELALSPAERVELAAIFEA